MITKKQIRESQKIRQTIRKNNSKIASLLHDNEHLNSKLVRLIFTDDKI